MSNGSKALPVRIHTSPKINRLDETGIHNIHIKTFVLLLIKYLTLIIGVLLLLWSVYL